MSLNDFSFSSAGTSINNLYVNSHDKRATLLNSITAAFSMIDSHYCKMETMNACVDW